MVYSLRIMMAVWIMTGVAVYVKNMPGGNRRRTCGILILGIGGIGCFAALVDNGLEVCVLMLVISAGAMLDLRCGYLERRWIVMAAVTGSLLRLGDGIEAWRYFAGAFALLSAAYVVNRFTGDGIGRADQYMMAVLGLFVKFEYAIRIILMGFVAAGMLGLMLIVLKKANKKTKMPFVPFIWMGVMIEWLI